MKKIYHFLITITIIFSGLLMDSCTKLEDQNFTSIVASKFVPTQDDLAALIGTAYGSWRSVLWSRGRVYWTLQEETTDSFVKACKANQSFCEDIHTYLHRHTWTAENEPALEDTWVAAYAGITDCNRILFQVESGQIPLDEENSKSLISEIRVLRASYYYVLCDLFGNIPITTKYDVEPDFLPKQNTRQEVYDFIVSEITESLPFLSEENNATTYGRFSTKGAANALLARTYLNAEVWTGTPRWAECIAACDEIISSGKYSLEPIQANCFKVRNENSVETIFAVPFGTPNVGLRHRLEQYSFPLEARYAFDLQEAGWGGLVAIPQFIESFDPADKRLTDAWLQGPLLTSSGEQIFIGRGDSLGKPFNIIHEVPSITHSEDLHGFRSMKYEVEIGGLTGAMDNDVPLLRYAHILMMKAESLMRLGQPGAGELVSDVRMRSFDDPKKAMVTDEQLLETSTYDYGLRDTYPGSPYYGTTHETAPIPYGRFLDELAWEFCAEAQRRSDMIRFGVFASKSRFSYATRNEGHRNLFPIPMLILNTNGNLKQNPGYN